MTNTELLLNIIKENGLKITWIADKMGISRVSLSNKVNNKTPFNQYEIASITDILHLSVKTKNAIFFDGK